MSPGVRSQWLQRPSQLSPSLGLWLLEEVGQVQPLLTSLLPAPRSSWGPLRPPFAQPLSLHRSHREACLCCQGRVLSGRLTSSRTLTPLSDRDAHHLGPHWRPAVQSGSLAFFWWVLGPQPLYLGVIRVPGLGGCLRKKGPLLLGQWGLVGNPSVFLVSSGSCICITPQPQVLRNAPLLGFDVSEES